ncbi:RuBisCO large subunit C-terminal-like domain-containing protein [Propionicicella superfundia]|uniref:RuBisCO large subunit C-terminal-like domain-containing protein n=1 Tax=Propionicicella superfundia TaxID=348582 RepID=UPI000402A000|nr:RuBisCO large subunit C-terminal-like domain-containing protein [Propionicicella superfundia]
MVFDVHVSIEAIRHEDFLLATYYLELDASVDVTAKARAFAIGQTIGTWVEVPGVTDEMRERHSGRVVSITQVPPIDVDGPEPPQRLGYLLTIALPTVNFGANFPMLFTTLLGNDASTSVTAKLVDLQFPDGYAEQFGGPRFGMAGVRDLVGVHDRPLLLNMIKPCTGLSPEAGAAIFREVALGGIDLIKDDELLGNPPFSPIADRVKAYTTAARQAFEETGHETIYICNVTDNPSRVRDNARRAVDAGARAVMVTYATVGYGTVQELAAEIGVPVLGHFAGSAVYFEGPDSGTTAALATGLFPRLAGCDLVLVTTPFGGYPLRRLAYLQTTRAISTPRPGLKPAMPVIGGGVHPGTLKRYLDDLGADIVLGAGGSIAGHPQGPAAGVRAFHQAIAAVQEGRDLREAARQYAELGAAIDLWGVQD